MPEGPDGKTIIVVKKVSGHAGHHGGAWKVAYADFVTSMMALFMVLWLVNSAAEPTRQRIASYFRKPGIFQKGSGTPLEIGGGGILQDSFAPPADANSQVMVNKKIYEIDAHTGKIKDYFDQGTVGGGMTEKGVDEKEKEEADQAREEELQKLREELEKATGTGSAAGSASEKAKEETAKLGQIDIKVDQRGLLIEIMDTESASMFELGSARIIPAARSQLLNIAAVLLKLPNPIDIEGHTDARPYRGKRADDYDNWNLSSDRAHAARRALQQAGLPDERIARVVGYADQRPKKPADRMDPSNRRITIAMRFTEQAKMLLEGTKTVETAPKTVKLNQEQKPAGSPAVSPQNPSDDSQPFEVETTSVADHGKQLKIEVGTVMPEGPPAPTPVEHKNESQSEPAKIEKDKIFGDRFPFFRK